MEREVACRARHGTALATGAGQRDSHITDVKDDMGGTMPEVKVGACYSVLLRMALV